MDAVHDGATLQILYEGRTADTALKDKHGFDTKFEDLFRQRSEEEIAADAPPPQAPAPVEAAATEAAAAPEAAAATVEVAATEEAAATEEGAAIVEAAAPEAATEAVATKPAKPGALLAAALMNALSSQS